MSVLELYRELYEHEKDSNHKMLDMLDSVPEANRSDTRFQRAVVLADHLAVCREKWLDYMGGTEQDRLAWWNETPDYAMLRSHFADIESNWTAYLAGLDEARLAGAFSFTESNGETYSLPVEVQVVQLLGHASYHRGQIALLVDQLGGETVDTDYVDWMWMKIQEKP